jgi:hypothetical protein
MTRRQRLLRLSANKVYLMRKKLKKRDEDTRVSGSVDIAHATCVLLSMDLEIRIQAIHTLLLNIHLMDSRFAIIVVSGIVFLISALIFVLTVLQLLRQTEQFVDFSVYFVNQNR